MSRTNILGSVGPDGINAEPFAHLVHGPILPADLYAELAAAFPDQRMILGDRRGRKENASARLPAVSVIDDQRIPQVWREFFAFHTSPDFWTEIVRVFGGALRATFPGMEAQAGRPLEEWVAGPRRDRKEKDNLDLRLDCQFVINTPAKHVSSVKTQHVDKLTTILSMLYYFRDPVDPSEGGDLEIYAWKRPPRFLPHRLVLPRDVEQRRVIRYAPNTLVAFVNSAQAVHGVSPRSPTAVARRYINFIVETPFKVFATPKIGLADRVMLWPETRKLGVRDVGGDRY